eukprot:scaffold12992_cov58-Phaeocystis_antarctica.AAC.6
METSYSSTQTAHQRGLGASVRSEPSMHTSPALERAAVDAFERAVREDMGNLVARHNPNPNPNTNLTLTLTLTR